MKTTFKTFLESTHYGNFEVAVNAIRNRCAPYLQETEPGQLLFRGLKGISNSKFFAHEQGPRADRKPRDSSAEYDTIFNYLGEKYLHIPNWRRSAYFCMTNPDTRPYGDPFLIYPIGNPIWSFSEDVYYDLTDTFRDQTKRIAQSKFPTQFYDAWDWRDAVAEAINKDTVDELPSWARQVLEAMGEDFQKNYTVTKSPTPAMYKTWGAELIASNGDGYIAVDLLRIQLSPPEEIAGDKATFVSAQAIAKSIDSYIRG